MRQHLVTCLAAAALAFPAMAAERDAMGNNPSAGGTMSQNRTNTGKNQNAMDKSQDSNAQSGKTASGTTASGTTAQNQQAGSINAEQANFDVDAAKLKQAEIAGIQRALNKQGFDAGNVDGIWGPETREAVKNFQRHEKIEARNGLDHNTLSALGVEVSDDARVTASITGSSSNQQTATGRNAGDSGRDRNAATTGSGSAASDGTSRVDRPGFQNDTNPHNDAGGMDSSRRLNMDPSPNTRTDRGR
jgi:peptidoglycan hydrolase-like protein with peptidoglycan-binding domain